MKTRDEEEVITGIDKSKTFGTVSAIATEAGQGEEQVTERTAGHSERHLAESKTPLVELEDLMLKLEPRKKTQVQRGGLSGNEEMVRHNKNENLDNYFNKARAAEEKLQ